MKIIVVISTAKKDNKERQQLKHLLYFSKTFIFLFSQSQSFSFKSVKKNMEWN